MTAATSTVGEALMMWLSRLMRLNLEREVRMQGVGLDRRIESLWEPVLSVGLRNYQLFTDH